jgi:rod shape-determining protein MreD
MKWFLPSLLLCATAQTVLLPPASLGGVRPDLFVLLLLIASPRMQPEAATVQGFLVGLCQDALSGGPLGLRAFTYSLLAFVAAWLSRDLYTDKPFAQFWFLLAGCGAIGALCLALLSFFVTVPPLVPTFLWVLLPEALLTATLGLLILWLPRVWLAIAPRL